MTERSHRNKQGDERYTFTFASMMGWKLGKRGVRIGLVRSGVGVGGLAESAHIWVCALVDREGEKKDLIVNDESGESTVAARNPIMRNDIVGGVRTVIDLLATEYRIKLGNVWWGGRKSDVGLRGRDNVCLESAMRFLERFCAEVEEKEGEVSVEMLQRYKLQLV